MTQQAAQQAQVVQSISFDGKELPFEFPRTSRMISVHPLGAKDPAKPNEPPPPLMWAQGESHPMIDGHIVVRMYVLPGVGVEVYSVEKPKDGVKGEVRGGARWTIPWPQVLMAEEVMDLATFVGEIEQAEKSDDEDPDDPPATTTGAAAVANGAAS